MDGDIDWKLGVRSGLIALVIGTLLALLVQYAV